MSNPSLQEVCESLGLISPQNTALIHARNTGGGDQGFIATALEMGLLSDEGIAKALATQFRLNMVPGDRIQKLSVRQDVLDLLPRALMRDHMLVPTFLDAEKKVLSILTANPADTAILKTAQEASKADRLRLFVAPKGAIRDLIERLVPDVPQAIAVPHPASQSGMYTVLWEPDAMMAGLLRLMVQSEQGNAEVVEKLEEVRAKITEGQVQRVLYRQVFMPEAEADIRLWHRQSPLLPVGTVTGWGPASLQSIPYLQTRDFFLRLVEFLLVSAERQRPEARARVRRMFRLVLEISQEMGFTTELQDTIAIAALMVDIDELTLMGGVVDDRAQGHRFGLALSVLRPLSPPYDIESLYSVLERRLAGQEGPGRHPGAEVLYTARAVVRAGIQDGEDPVAALGSEAARHDAGTLRALTTVLRRGGLRQQVAAAGSFHQLVVLAERDASLLTSLESRLREAGYDVLVVGDGDQALAAARSRPVAAIVAAFRLPKKDGISLLLEVHRDVRLASIPVILMTESQQPNDVARGLELGAEDVLSRPIHLDLLLARLRRALERRVVQNRAGVMGRLQDLPLVDLLQTLMMGGRTAWVRVLTPEMEGWIQLRAGQMVAAEVGNITAEEAVYRLVDTDEGRFEVHFEDHGQSNLHVSSQFLLLEAMRRRDERRGTP